MRLIRTAALLTLTALAACGGGSIKPQPEVPVRSQPVVFNVPTGKIALGRVDVALPNRRGIGTYYRNIDCFVRVRSIMNTDFPGDDQIADEIRKDLIEAKLTVIPGTFGSAAQAKDADYYLTASIPAAHADLCIDNFFLDGPADIDAQVQVTWRLVSVKDGQVVLETNTTGSAKAKDETQKIDAGAFAAVHEATRQLLDSVTLQQYLTFGRIVTAQPAAVASGVAIPAGGARPIPAPPPGIAPIRPAVAVALPPVLVPVRAARPVGAVLDRTAARNSLVAVGPGAGAGFITGGDGYIFTTAAAVGDSVVTPVKLANGTTLEGRVVRKDATADIALLQVDGTVPPALSLQPKRIAVGDRLLGLGLNGPVSGTVAAARSAGAMKDIVRFEQPVGVGAPVLDENGNVIGLLQEGGAMISVGSMFRILTLGAQPSDE